MCAACVNYFDLLMLVGRYQTKPALPFTLGSECSGRVVECGEGVTQWQVGDAVMVGMALGGCMAEELVVPALHCLPSPPSFSFAESAALGVGFYTAYNGLVQRGGLKQGEWLLVTGAGGGMGLAAVQLGQPHIHRTSGDRSRYASAPVCPTLTFACGVVLCVVSGVRLGARVIALASCDAKLRAATACGAAAAINSTTTQDLKSRVKELTASHGVDVLYDVVGGEAFERCLGVMAGGGRMLVVGFAGGRVQSIPANLVLVKGVAVIGVRAGADMQRSPQLVREMNRQLRAWTEGEGGRALAPLIDSQVDVEEFREAYRRVASRSVIGKAVVVWRAEPKLQQPHTATASTSTNVASNEQRSIAAAKL